MKTFVLIGLLAMAMVVVAPTAAAHYIVASYPDPVTGECKNIVLPGSDRYIHGGALVSVGECWTWHA